MRSQCTRAADGPYYWAACTCFYFKFYWSSIDFKDMLFDFLEDVQIHAQYIKDLWYSAWLCNIKETSTLIPQRIYYDVILSNCTKWFILNWTDTGVEIEWQIVIEVDKQCNVFFSWYCLCYIIANVLCSPVSSWPFTWALSPSLHFLWRHVGYWHMGKSSTHTLFWFWVWFFLCVVWTVEGSISVEVMLEGSSNNCYYFKQWGQHNSSFFLKQV